MMKRGSLNTFNDIKRRKLGKCGQDGSSSNTFSPASALAHIAALFPVEKFCHNLPPIVMRHQIYALVKCRTEVDRCLNNMRKKGEIRLFKLGPNDNEMAVVYMKDYKSHVEKCCPHNATVENFMVIVTSCPDISFSKNVLLDVYGIKDENISKLIQMGVMTSRDVGCYWLSIPRAGEFVKTLIYGRRVTLQHIKRTKFKEILQADLEQRNLPKKAKLPTLYYIYDVIGSDLVVSVSTSSGTVLRLQPENQ